MKALIIPILLALTGLQSNTNNDQTDWAQDYLDDIAKSEATTRISRGGHDSTLPAETASNPVFDWLGERRICHTSENRRKKEIRAVST